MNAIILCGGLSTRLGEITKQKPKILLEIGGQSILDWQLGKLKTVGVKEVVLAAGHLAHVLHDSVGTECHGLELIYAIEDKQLGTGGAIKHGMEYLTKPKEPTWILNGDILYTTDFGLMAKELKSDSDGIILAQWAEDASTYGTLEYDDDNHLQAFKEKEGLVQSGYINGGLYLFNPKSKQYFSKADAFSVEYDVFPKMENLYVFESDTAWVDVGVPERLEWARVNVHLFG
jgi:D-glycero-alpha-D-manno-heptose 1-phosphate guanylyltransferase